MNEIQEIDVLSALEEPTAPTIETQQQEPQTESYFDNLEFEEEPEEVEIINAQEVEEPEEYTDADAELTAEMLVELIDSFRCITMTPIARMRVRRKVGDKDTIQRMKLLELRKDLGEKLTKAETWQLNRYQIYKRDCAEIEKIIPYTDEEKQRFNRTLARWAKKKKFKVGEGELAMMEIPRIIAIMTI